MAAAEIMFFIELGIVASIMGAYKISLRASLV
jgi:hypothetical protein